MPFEVTHLDRIAGIFPRNISEGLDERFTRLMEMDPTSEEYRRLFPQVAEQTAVRDAAQASAFTSRATGVSGFSEARLGERAARAGEELMFPLPPQFKGVIGPRGILAPVDPNRLGLIGRTPILFRSMLDPRAPGGGVDFPAEGFERLRGMLPGIIDPRKESGTLAYIDFVERLQKPGIKGFTPLERIGTFRDTNSSLKRSRGNLFPRATVGTGLPYPMALEARKGPGLAKGGLANIRQLALPLFEIDKQRFRFIQNSEGTIIRNRFTADEGLDIYQRYAAVNEKRAQEEVISALSSDETINFYKSQLGELEGLHKGQMSEKLDYFAPERRATRTNIKELAMSINGMFDDGAKLSTSYIFQPSSDLTGANFSKLIVELQDQGRRPFDPVDGNFQYEKRGISIFNAEEAGFDLDDFNKKAVQAGAEPLVLPSGTSTAGDLIDPVADLIDEGETPGLGSRRLEVEMPRADRMALAWDDFSAGVRGAIEQADEADKPALRALLRPNFVMDRPEPDIIEDFRRLLDDPKALRSAVDVDAHVAEALSDAADRRATAEKTMKYTEGPISGRYAKLTEKRLINLAERSEMQKAVRGNIDYDAFRDYTRPKTGPRMAMEFAAETLVNQRELFPKVGPTSGSVAGKALIQRFEMAMEVVAEMYPEYGEGLFFDESGKINDETNDFIRKYFTNSDARAARLVAGNDPAMAEGIAKNLRLGRSDVEAVGDIFEQALRRALRVIL